MAQHRTRAPADTARASGSRTERAGSLSYDRPRQGTLGVVAAKLSMIPRAMTNAVSAGELLAGKYLLVRPLDTGGMGAIWEGVHVTLGLMVAIKVMRDDQPSNDLARAQFEREAQCAARVRAKHVVQVFDCGVAAGGVPYIVMDLLDGRSLMDTVEEEGPLSMRDTTRLVRQAANAIREVHAQGIIHRDVKPSNLMLVRDPEAEPHELPYIVKLIDFGVAKLVRRPQDPFCELGEPAHAGPFATLPGTIVGTPNFMAPEHFAGISDPGPSADLWGLATSAFTAVVGSIPFPGDNLAELVPKLCSDPLPIPSQVNSDVPVEFDRWFARACARDPGARFQSPQELAHALEAACDDYESMAGHGSMRHLPISQGQMAAASGAFEVNPQFNTLDDLPTTKLG